VIYHHSTNIYRKISRQWGSLAAACSL